MICALIIIVGIYLVINLGACGTMAMWEVIQYNESKTNGDFIGLCIFYPAVKWRFWWEKDVKRWFNAKR